MPTDGPCVSPSILIPSQASMMTFSERKMLGVLSPALQARITSLVNAPLIRQAHS